MAERCLRAVEAAREPDLDTELVVVLNAVPRETRDVVRALAPTARVIESPVNTGTNAGWNLAFGVARGRWVALLHEDTEPRAGWLGALVRAAEANPRAALVGSRLYYPSGELWASGSAIWQDGYSTLLNAERWPAGATATGVYAVDGVQSASMLVERAAWEAIGGFDERLFPAMFSEMDLAIAVWLSGRTVIGQPESVAVHATGAMIRPTGALGSPRFREFLWRRANKRTVAKWGDALERFAPLPPGASAFDAGPADVERAMERAAERAAESAVARDLPAPSRALTTPDGGSPAVVDEAMAARFNAAQWAFEREFADWLAVKLREMEEGFEWMTGQRDAALAEIERLRAAQAAGQQIGDARSVASRQDCAP
jgi:GT2 family glycosyltransferase